MVTINPNQDAKRLPEFKGNYQGGKVVVIVGGGAAGNSAAETLRKEGFKGKVVLISQEDYVPYDRPKLSKNMALQADAIALRPKKFYEEIGVELVLGDKVIELDASTKKIKTEKRFTRNTLHSFVHQQYTKESAFQCSLPPYNAQHTLPLYGTSLSLNIR